MVVLSRNTGQCTADGYHIYAEDVWDENSVHDQRRRAGGLAWRGARRDNGAEDLVQHGTGPRGGPRFVGHRGAAFGRGIVRCDHRHRGLAAHRIATHPFGPNLGKPRRRRREMESFRRPMPSMTRRWTEVDGSAHDDGCANEAIIRDRRQHHLDQFRCHRGVFAQGEAMVGKIVSVSTHISRRTRTHDGVDQHTARERRQRAFAPRHIHRPWHSRIRDVVPQRIQRQQEAEVRPPIRST